MSVLVYTELADGQFKKSSLEAIFYGSKVAAQVGGSMTVLAIGSASDDELAKAGNFGASKVLHANAQNLASENIMAYSKVLSETAKSLSAKVVISAKSSLADAVMARAAGALKAGLVGNVVELPNTTIGFKVKRSIFTGKAFAETSITSDIKFIAIKKNVLPLEETTNSATVEKLSVDTGSLTESSKVLETIKATGAVSLPEADLVVSGGRGMKGPENWQPLLDLAEALGAATACSKPVSDLDWRPHHEHVGQTGVKVAPNLYIACGISGAIQHLAGVNSSKVIVVINKDPEAPFFKAADYGIVGDVFDVLPKLTAAVKAL
ncbi:electron transfer flavoprotein subunit alpha/FixB family protein [Lacihabitans sp. CCS-44]|uniref:electron transfer flavoprotein subunit alpha/FixB family protein n=1 Tax=Lacihabitans sp. CCS-44 TaxID=2487331 RepID=UPI0020CE337F|nr:electron transfer flavoprotein subunit alpha/FixB family protein [Lacihabitans sp. CCS-44]MCP9755928.1 electron transfer flavoprotein subunit alpha/FixB family protein [Lacihabitans sp. CCS-44]